MSTAAGHTAMPASAWRIGLLLNLMGVATSAILFAIYARGGAAWPLGFIALLPWLLALEHSRSMGASMLSGVAMSIAFALAVLGWFGVAMGSYTGAGTGLGMLALVVAAPLLQAQFIAYAVVRYWAGRSHGPILRAFAASCAYLACEWLLPKLLGDTLGHGLAPAILLRQVADLGGAAGISLLLILVNEALLLAWMRRRAGWRRMLPPLAIAALLPALMAGYGLVRLSALQLQLSQPSEFLRVGMVQANLVDYEARRRELGSYAVVREVLDTHFALSRGAREQHQVDVLLWPETVYPTTFGHPRSEDGAALDREILDFVDNLGVPLVFGSYDVDADGEYNAAAFVEPGVGLIGYYRKTHPFPLTEYVPSWLDGPGLRRLLPWTGGWRPGSGVRVMPLRTGDGRELNVVTLICLDDVRPALAIDGARLGAQAIIGLSNDAWFSTDPRGAHLHLAVAAFRSIETRMPQLRVTTNGITAFIDPSGEVLARTQMGDRAVLAGGVPLQDPPMTLMRRWGDWVGKVAAGLLLLFGAWSARSAWVARRGLQVPAPTPDLGQADYGATVVVLGWYGYALLALLRLLAIGGLLWLALAMLLRYGMQVNSLTQIQVYVWAVLVPLLAAWAMRRAFVASVSIDNGRLIFRGHWQRIDVPLQRIVALRPWSLPLAGPGLDIELASGQRLPQRIVLSDPAALHAALHAAGAPLRAYPRGWPGLLSRMLAQRAAAGHRWLDHVAIKFVLFPLLPAIPAFRLHQVIAFGGSFGEYLTYGLQAWVSGLLIWWASWSLGLMLFAALLRLLIEIGSGSALLLRPEHARSARLGLETCGRLLYYIGVPVWLLLRIVVA